VIDDWIDSEQHRDLQSNSIDPVASVGKLLFNIALPRVIAALEGLLCSRFPTSSVAGATSIRPIGAFKAPVCYVRKSKPWVRLGGGG
jgi:hypothetical protein